MTDPRPLPPDRFADRHLGARADAVEVMLAALGTSSLDVLVDKAIPATIRATRPLALPAALTEPEALAALRATAARNIRAVQMIGQGYSDTVTPAVIRRGVLENPAWYTAYTPYQPEISQGRLEALLNFQTVVADLTALPVANASLLDEASAVAEAVLLMRRATKGRPGGRIVVDADCHPQTLAVVTGRARAAGLPLDVVDLSADPADPADTSAPAVALPDGDVIGVVVQQPGTSGRLRDLAPIVAAAHERGALVTVAADLLSLTLLTPPGELGADIAVGSAQRFGVPLFFGGPHAAFMAVRSGLERSLPGRLVGVSVDSAGAPAYRLALQTREQHIRREKATSNICTAQALLAVVASMYAVHHGADGLTAIAERVHGHAHALARALRSGGVDVVHDAFFDTVLARVPGAARDVAARAESAGVNLRRVDDDLVAVACDEVTTGEHLRLVTQAFGLRVPVGAPDDATTDEGTGIPDALRRTSAFLTHPVFAEHRSETQLMRYLRRLADRDLALDRTMIPLGSCTMKLNAAAEMEAISWPEFAGIHPYAPASQTAGWRALIAELETWLAEITGYARVSVQPNAGSQGELAGLLAIGAYHRARGQGQRDVCLIPSSAHGTNAASAVLAGMSVAVVTTAPDGTIDHQALDAAIERAGDRLAAIMITYPSTHGVYDHDVRSVCERVHAAGGQVYVDGANLNALVGLAKPGEFGGDVSHLNLHKTFCIPHGGGGPGVGPVAVAEHLVPFLPATPTPGLDDGPDDSADGAGVAATGTPVAGSRWGSAGVLPIAWAYVAMMGADGLTQATRRALLAANYLATRLGEHFPILYTGPGGLVAHECILDLRPITAATGVTVEDVAKRLIDYGFHAPTVAFPVAGTLMVEPTESEDLAELDRFVSAMAGIRAEIAAIERGDIALADSPLRHAPHTAAAVITSDWDRAYPREVGVFPVPSRRVDTYFPPVGRIDGARGDRNLVCSCPPPEAFEVSS